MTMIANLEISLSDRRTFNYGTISCGADTYSGVWTKGTQVFSYDDRLRSSAKSHHTNFFRTPWKKYGCVDLLIVTDSDTDQAHHDWVNTWGYSHRATNLLVFHSDNILTSHKGNGFKKWCKLIRGRGYDIRTWHLNAVQSGAAIWSKYTVSFCFPMGAHTKLPTHLPIGHDTSPRSCSNVMREYMIPKYTYHPIKNMSPCAHPKFHNVIGHYKGGLVYHWRGPSGNNPTKDWIFIPDKGMRRIILEELIQLKGLTSNRYTNISTPVLASSVEQHIWATIGEHIQPFLLKTSLSDVSRKKNNHLHIPTRTTPVTNIELTPDWKWEPPDLSKDSPFYKQRVTNLKAAVVSLGIGHEHFFEQGLDILDRHRLNYGPNGPQSLTVLWWEWPKTHWKELREGASMNFMDIPIPGLVPNQKLTGKALEAAISFTDELIDLGVLSLAEGHYEVANNFPLFFIEKLGQPGQYRGIADGKAGGQNDVCVGDPCQMTSPDHILPHLYTNGWSGVIDASKFFHMFRTQDEEKKYLGLIHPRDNSMWVYETLPMGTRNSPGISGRFGAAFLRRVIDKFPTFQGTPVDNSIMAYFTKKLYHPDYGEGRALVGTDGIPIVIVWIHVDDILAHGPTLAKLSKGLKILLDTTVELGLICQTCKTVSPTQTIKFCGFIYDTQNIPTIIIPDNKVSRAIAMIDYIGQGCSHVLARLVVSMVVGFLQSLVPATPGNIGASFLRPLYEDLHLLQDNDSPGTKQFYFCTMTLRQRSQDCLWWWREALTSGLSRQTQPRDIATIGVSWGDGSGTGTGGTINFLTLEERENPITLDIWMGTWNGTVVHSTSNWKEMCTLRQTLQNEAKLGGARVRHRRLIYCTDNSVMCDIFRKGVSKSDTLQRLFLEVKLLELQLECHLLLIHVPGTTMIREGTDGLSRGIPIQPLYRYEGNSLLPLLWRAASPSTPLLNWALSKIKTPWNSTASWIFHEDYTDWSRSKMLGQNVLWCVTPGFGKQAILQALYTWIETPTQCGHIFIIPRIMQREFGRVSKNVLYLGQHTDLPLSFTLLVPFVLLYIPPFNRSHEYELLRAKQRLDIPATEPIPSWIQSDIDQLQRLSLPM